MTFPVSTSSSELATQRSHYAGLSQRCAFVTGGGSGIGAAIVYELARQGVRVAFVDTASEPSKALVAAIVQEGFLAPWWRECDVKSTEALQCAIVDASQAVGDFWILVNNVANDDRHTIEEVTPAYYDDRMAINQRPAFFAIQSVLPGMKRLGGGSVINLGSTGWQSKGDAFPCYSIAKSSVNGLTRGLARTLGKDRIRINTVSPGWVMTQRQIKLWLNPETERGLVHNQCLPDRMQPQDIANMVAFLASDAASMCTAQEFTVDAGWN
jgi:D-xylose 1-dehydrogenase